MPQNDDTKQSLRTQKFLFIIAIISIAFIAFSLWSGVWPTWLIIKQIFLTIGLSGLVASIIPIIQSYTIDRNLTDSISKSVKETINDAKKKIDAIQSKIYPKTLYIGDNEDELFNNAIDKSLHKATHFKFMSISAEYLLNNRLMKFQPKGTIDIQLLLQNPFDNRNLQYRYDQLKHYEKNKSVESLKKEIIASIIRSYCLVRIYDSYNIRIRLHNEFPICRLEFSGENDLFISYYKSQFGEKNWGPVAHYKKENDVFNSYNYYYSKLWDIYKENQIDLSSDTHANPLDLINEIESKVGKLNLSDDKKKNCIKKVYDDFKKNEMDNYKIVKDWLQNTTKEDEPAQLFSIMGGASAQTGNPMSAEKSDPVVLGWMTGFPTPADKLIMQPESDFFSFPKLRWTVCHIRELMPTKQVSRGIGAPKPLEYALNSGIDEVTFTPIGVKGLMTWKESLSRNYTDGILIIHKGKVVYERYFGALNEAGKHAAMSMTKSMTGLLAEILVVEGKLDDKAMVDSIVPELKGSAFGNATVRQVMDMTTALDYSEDYSDPNADIWVYSKAASPLAKPKDYKGPNGYFEYLQTVKQKGVHGQAFGYRTINTDALGWIVSRVTGKDLAQLLSERIWSRMGAEQDGYMNVDAKGTPFAGGGLSAGLRDLGRIGLLMLNGGEINGQRLFQKKVTDKIRAGGDRAAFAMAGYKTLDGGSYRSMWWVFHNKYGAFAARGVHGQTIYVDPTAEMVIARFSSFPAAKNAKIDPTSLPAYQAVAEYLMRQ